MEKNAVFEEYFIATKMHMRVSLEWFSKAGPLTFWSARLASIKGLIREDFQDWYYLSGCVLLEVKEKLLELPVSRNIMGM